MYIIIAKNQGIESSSNKSSILQQQRMKKNVIKIVLKNCNFNHNSRTKFFLLSYPCIDKKLA